MGRNIGTWLVAHGLTNKAIGDWGEIASAVQTKRRYALCCGIPYLDEANHACKCCGHALRWYNDLASTAEKNIEAYIARWADKQDKLTKERQINESYKARHRRRVEAAMRERMLMERKNDNKSAC